MICKLTYKLPKLPYKSSEAPSRLQALGFRLYIIVKIGKCHETDKYPTKSDENLSIWSQTGQGNLSRRVPDPKNARGVVKNEGVQVAVGFRRKGGV